MKVLAPTGRLVACPTREQPVDECGETARHCESTVTERRCRTSRRGGRRSARGEPRRGRESRSRFRSPPGKPRQPPAALPLVSLTAPAPPRWPDGGGRR